MSSSPVNTVAPVVVRPDKDSNAASVKLVCTVSVRYSGMAPNRPRPV